jgi:hypothetical protein
MFQKNFLKEYVIGSKNAGLESLIYPISSVGLYLYNRKYKT